MKLFYLSFLVTFVASHPGLLKVPKVYNAVITSNQNLSPSRAYPVIQPVIHRTAVGYVPPFYYTQVAPHFTGPEVMHVPRESSGVKSEADGRGRPNEESAKLDEQREERTEESRNEEADRAFPKEDPKRKKEEEEEAPLSFYPNYQSLYYDPYFYTYNTFNPHLIPGTYYVNYRPFGQVPPIPAEPLKQKVEQQLLPGYHEEKKNDETLKEKIPDVPPPPVPASISKSS